MTPNWFAYAALLAWPAVAIYLYSSRSIGEATLWTILGGYLLLPVGTSMKIEMVPEFDKTSISSLAALLGCVLVGRKFPKIFQGFGLAELLIAIFVLGPFVTAELNGDPIRVGQGMLPAESHYDALSAVVSQLIALTPFFLARQYMRNVDAPKQILRSLVIAGLFYSVLMLIEIRMSPQLNVWIFGYFPHSFIQQYRDGGFRPVVFLGHGLPVAFFAMSVAVAAAALWRTGERIGRFRGVGLTAYFIVILALCKTLGAFLYGLILAPLVRWTSPRLQFRIAMVFVVMALSYPMMRTMDLVPTQFLLETANLVSAERESSLKTRFDNEQILLAHANQRLWFGWGRFGRNRVYGRDGEDQSTTDGHWIITVGTFGIFGFVGEFGLLAFSVFQAAFAVKILKERNEQIYLAAIGLIVAVGMIDLLPNSFLDSWQWLVVGALLGRSEAIAGAKKDRRVVSGANPVLQNVS